MVIDAVDRFAKRTAEHCVTYLDPAEVEKREATWPPFYVEMVAKHIAKILGVRVAS